MKHALIKETSLNNRYISYDHIKHLKEKYEKFKIQKIGNSVLGEEIISYTIGSGKIKLLFWSQMHGNESTSTKALFDLFNYLQLSNEDVNGLLNTFEMCFIPMLNPDGAKAYTRLNANQIDLNRDAVALSQPESKVLRAVFDAFKPDYCFNLHGQRTIFSAGTNNKSAILSFLSPSEDDLKTVTESRKKGMAVIAAINNRLQQVIPDHVGRYDDGYNINCVGDTFQTLGVPTILFEAGHYPDDYEREQVRELFFEALLVAIKAIQGDFGATNGFEDYFMIPENEKLFCDILLKDVKNSTNNGCRELAIQYKEVLNENKVSFIPVLRQLPEGTIIFGHKEINCRNKHLFKDPKQDFNQEEIVKYLFIDNKNVIKMSEK